MMNVTDIIVLDKRKVKVYMDNKLFCVLYKGELNRYGINKGEVITTEVLSELYKLLYKRARERSFYILKIRDYTEFEIVNKLKKSYYPIEVIDKVLEFLKKYNYINDERFVDNYLNTYIDKESMMKIKSKLYSKGISSEMIKMKISECNIKGDRVIIDRYFSIVEKIVVSDDKKKTKYYNRLLRKGFSYDDINNAISLYYEKSIL